MSPSRLCVLPLVLLALSLAACGELRQASSEAAARPEPDSKQKKDDKEDRKDDKKKDDKDKDDKDKDDKKDKKKEEPKNADLADVHAEVTVLQVFHAFDLNAEQIKAFGDAAAKTAQKPPLRKEWKVGDKYKKALHALRAALRTGDDEKIEAANAHLTAALKDEDEPEFEDVEITAEARKQAPALFAKLNARQIVFYLSGLADTFPDPLEKLTAALAESRKLQGKEWRKRRDDVAYEVAWLIVGLDADKEEKMRDKISDFLDKAHDLKDDEYDKEKAALEKSAREMVGKLGSTDVIRHYVERVLAETLSNHRLAAAVEGRKKEEKKDDKKKDDKKKDDKEDKDRK
jgi:hypothetical protein